VVDGQLLGEVSVDSLKDVTFVLPRHRSGEPYVELHFPDAITPKALGLADDNSLLAVQLLALRVDPLPVIGKAWAPTGRDGVGLPALLTGWRPPEAGFTWSNGRFVALAFGIGRRVKRDLLIRLHLTPLVAPGRLEMQRVDVTAKGVLLGRYEIADQQVLEIPVPRHFVDQGVLQLDIELPDAASLSDLSLAEDPSVLAIQLHALSLEEIRSKSETKSDRPLEEIVP
jgi:hypothetical protein